MIPRFTLVAVLCCTASFAAAQTAAPGTTPPSAPTTTTPPAVTQMPAASMSEEYAAIQAAKVAIADAISVAEKTGGQGKAISVDFERQSGNEAAHYEVKVIYPDGKLVEHEIDAMTGSVIKSENQPFERYFTRLKPADFQGAKTSLREALTVAERHVGNAAKAVEAEVEKDGSAVVYEIDLVTASGKHEVKIDASGQIVAR